MNNLSIEMQNAVAFAKTEITEGKALAWIIEGGVLSVETDQGWSVWYDPAEWYNYDDRVDMEGY